MALDDALESRIEIIADSEDQLVAFEHLMMPLAFRLYGQIQFCIAFLVMP